MSVLINASTSTGLVQSADTSGEIELQSNGTTALKVNTNEGIQILNCLGVGGATPSTSGAGITFPATQSASTDANTLDDYEEGTWTPTDASGAGLTLTINTTSNYVKIGSMVYAVCSITFPSTINAAQVNIGGLPFSSGGTGVGFWGGSTRYTTFSQITMVAVAPSSATFQGYLINGGALTNTQAGTLRFDFAFSYRVA